MAMEQMQNSSCAVYEEENFIKDIELLQNVLFENNINVLLFLLHLQHGINVADIKKLKTAGICTIRGKMIKKN